MAVSPVSWDLQGLAISTGHLGLQGCATQLLWALEDTENAYTKPVPNVGPTGLVFIEQDGGSRAGRHWQSVVGFLQFCGKNVISPCVCWVTGSSGCSGRLEF